MKKGGAVIFEQISSIKNKSRSASVNIDNNDLIAVVLDAANTEYQLVLTAEQRNKGAVLYLENLESAMTQHWPQISDTNHKDDGNEITLIAFQCVCFKCGAKGHKSNDPKCPMKNVSGGAQNNVCQGGKGWFSGKCNNCGKDGHKEADCWAKAGNEGKRPAWYKQKETNASAIDQSGGGVEFLLCGMNFPALQEFLLDPNVWIADTGAMVHTTPYKADMVKHRPANRGDAITMGNGASEEASINETLKGTNHDKHRNEVEPANLDKVRHLPRGRFNLFSVTKLMKQRWTLGGDVKALWLDKGVKT
jgi:hypothetical protein